VSRKKYQKYSSSAKTDVAHPDNEKILLVLYVFLRFLLVIILGNHKTYNQIAFGFEQPIWCSFLQRIEIYCFGSGFLSGFKLNIKQVARSTEPVVMWRYVDFCLWI
jgi:hypothetical protein